MKNVLKIFYLLLFVIATIGLIISLYEAVMAVKPLIYYLFGVICYLSQNLLVNLYYNVEDNKKPLKPKNCPKCNGEGKIRIVGDNRNYYIIECNNCNYTPFKFSEGQTTLTKAIKLWNRRV